jgi:hypothetical protein
MAAREFSCGREHISIQQMTLEPSQIPGYDRHGGTVPIPNPDRS